MGWCGIIFTSIIVFLAPILLALHARIELKDEGSVKVYGGYLKSRRSQIYALSFLLFVIIILIVLAVVGEFVSIRE